MWRMKQNWVLPVLAGGTVAVLSVVGGLLPYTGVMEPPQGFDPFNFVGVVEKILWIAVAAIAASRPYTRRFAALGSGGARCNRATMAIGPLPPHARWPVNIS